MRVSECVDIFRGILETLSKRCKERRQRSQGWRPQWGSYQFWLKTSWCVVTLKCQSCFSIAGATVFIRLLWIFQYYLSKGKCTISKRDNTKSGWAWFGFCWLFWSHSIDCSLQIETLQNNSAEGAIITTQSTFDPSYQTPWCDVVWLLASKVNKPTFFFKITANSTSLFQSSWACFQAVYASVPVQEMCCGHIESSVLYTLGLAWFFFV